MTVFAECDFCDKQMPLGARRNLSVINHGDPDQQVANFDLCVSCFDAFVSYIKHCRTNRAAK